ncbi:MAG: TRAP transporter small permease subunit [Kiloniellales bacterium]|nr:TRAP transporter small permease subunit [Kiloniellales bacterium]
MVAKDRDYDPSHAYGNDLAGRIGLALEAVVEWAGKLTMWIALAMVLLIATNVIMRYLFSIGPVALQELEWHLMAPVALIGSSYTLRHHSHVRIDIFYEKFGQRTRALVNLLVAISLLVVSLLIFELSLDFVYQAYVIGEGSPDPGGLPHRFLLKAVIPLGFALLAFQALAHAILYTKRLFGR